jgi:hypothetical protein
MKRFSAAVKRAPTWKLELIESANPHWRDLWFELTP